MAIYVSLAVTLLTGCLATQRNAPEKPKVAVLEFRGDKSAELQRIVLEILGEDYAIVDGDAYRDSARELKARRMKRSHVKKVAAHLDVEAVIYGKLVKRGKRRYTLSLRVRDGETGKLVKRLRIPVRKRRSLSDKNARKLERKLMAVMEDVAPQPLPVADTKKPVGANNAKPTVDPDGIEIEDDYVIVDRIRDGQVVDDEEPPDWK